MSKAECILVPISVKSLVWKWEFTKALAWAVYFSSRFWNPLKFRKGCLCENLYTHDLVIISQSLKEPEVSLILWKPSLERKVLNVNKIKVLVFGPGLNMLCVSPVSPSSVVVVLDGSTEVTLGKEKLEVLPFFCYLASCALPITLEFVYQECHVPCKRNLDPQLCITYNAMSRPWSASCAVSSPRIKSVHKTSWKGCDSTTLYSAPVDSDIERGDGWLKKD